MDDALSIYFSPMENDRLSRRTFLEGCGSLVLASVLGRRCPLAATADLAHDSNRPQFHLLPAANWMNDPNGPLFWKGQYHMCFQYNPNAAVWGDMHWAHAVSPDMVHWRHMPVALAPTPGGPDEGGCFSGSAVDFNGVATVLYTGVKTSPAADATLRDGTHNFRETQCLATAGDPDLRTWNKLSSPVVPSPPPGMAVTGFRDPCLWKEADGWYMGIGSGVAGKGGCILLYRSQDLRHWEYLHPLVNGEWNGKTAMDPVDSGEMWECPDFFALGKRHVLLYSTERKVYWASGEYDAKEHVFYPQQKGALDRGSRAYYAAKSMIDEKGNRILWGWIPETRPPAEYVAAGWAGLMSLPRVLTLNDEGELEMRVSSKFSDLRSSDVKQWHTGQIGTLGPLSGLRAELLLHARPANGPVRVSIETDGRTAVAYELNPAKGIFALNGQKPGLQLPQGPMNLSLFLDGSVIEVFVSDRLSHTSRVYGLDPQRATLTLHDPSSAISGAKLWQLRPISPDRLTSRTQDPES